MPAIDTQPGSTVVPAFPTRAGIRNRYADSFLGERMDRQAHQSPDLIKTLPVRPGRRSARSHGHASPTGAKIWRPASSAKENRLCVKRKSLLSGGQLLEV